MGDCQLNSCQRRRRTETHQPRYSAGMSATVSQNTDIRTIARQLPTIPGLDRDQSTEAWVDLLKHTNESMIDGERIRDNGAITIPTVEMAEEFVRQRQAALEQQLGPFFPASSAANRQAELAHEAATRSASLNANLDCQGECELDDEPITPSRQNASLAEVADGMDEREESAARYFMDSLRVSSQATGTVGTLMTMAEGTAFYATGGTAVAVAIPAGMVISIAAGLYRMGEISAESDRVGVANGYVDALIAFSQARDFDSIPQLAQTSGNHTEEYERGFQAASDYLVEVRNDHPERFLEMMRTVWQTDRNDLFNAVYGHGDFSM